MTLATDTINRLRVSPDHKIPMRETLEALEYGLRVCLENGEAATLRKVVWRLLQYAVRAEESFSDREQSWLRKVVWWPEIQYDALDRQIQAHDDYQIRRLVDPDRNPENPDDRLELQNVPKSTNRNRVVLERYLAIMSWLRCVKGRDPGRDKEIILALAKGYRVPAVKMLYMRSCSEKAVEMVKDKVLNHITELLSPICRKNNLTFVGKSSPR